MNGTNRISTQELRDLDDEVRENYLEILTRCYLAFESVHQYVSDLKYFLHEVNDGTYIQQSLESILQDGEGKQILVWFDYSNIISLESNTSQFLFSRLNTNISDRIAVSVWCDVAGA